MGKSKRKTNLKCFNLIENNTYLYSRKDANEKFLNESFNKKV